MTTTKRIVFILAIFFIPLLVYAQSNVESKNINRYHSDQSGLKDSTNTQNNIERPNYVEGEVLVKFKSNQLNLNEAENKATKFAETENLDLKENIKSLNVTVYKTKNNESVEDVIVRLSRNSNVEYAQPNFQYYPLSINTDDTYKDYLWGLDNYGQTVNGVNGTNDADIDAPEAWAINEGTNGDAIVAIIDYGVAYNHPDLKSNMWNGTNCKSSDGNQLGDCLHGYDFEDNDRDPLPTSNSHGTHLAGTIAAVKNNGKGIIGVAPRAKIMALKSSLTTTEIIKAIDFAEYNGAKIINASWGGTNDDQLLKSAIASFPGLFIAAAGNCGDVNSFLLNGCTSQNQTLYPASYDLSNIVSVAATDQNDNLASFSNYGVESVDVAAPGVNIYSTIADSNVLDEDFEEITVPNVPSGWTREGTGNNWRTYDYDGGVAWGNVLYSDPSYPYSDNEDTLITSSTIDLSDANRAVFDFWTNCDTEYWYSYWYDYMSLEISADGNNFSQLIKWHEGYLDYLNGDAYDSTGSATYHFADLEIPSQYLTSNFKSRLRWITNSFDNNYLGCMVDDITIIKFTDGSDEKYDFYDGTSMATPHVAGLAALIMGYNPDLNISEVKRIILESGDLLPSLNGKIATQKRINAYSALTQATQAPSLGLLFSQSSGSNPYIKRVGHHGAKIKSFSVYNDEGGIASIEADINGDEINEIVVAPEPGLGAKVKAYTKNGTALTSFSPFGSTFNKGISITAGDVNGDSKDEIIVAPLTKGTPKIKVFRYSNGKFTLLKEARVYGNEVPGGINLSSGDVNGDGVTEIIVSPYQEKDKTDRVVKIYAYRDGKLVKLASKQIYSDNRYQGIKTITADMDGDGKEEIITTPSLNYGDDISVYSYSNGKLTYVDDVWAYSDDFDGLTSIASGDINNDGKDEIVLSVRTEGQPYIFIYKLNDEKLKEHDRIRVYDKDFTGGVNLAVLDVDGDNKAEVITAPYSGKQKIKVWDVESTKQKLHSSFWAFKEDFEGGVNFAL